MDQLILNVKNKRKLPFLKELLQCMDFVEVVEPPKLTAKEKKILADIEEAVEQVKLHEKGKIKLKSWPQVLDEI